MVTGRRRTRPQCSVATYPRKCRCLVGLAALAPVTVSTPIIQFGSDARQPAVSGGVSGGVRMAVIRDVVFDCEHPASLARFWAEALDEYAVAAYDDAELQQLEEAGFAGPEDDPTVLVEGPAGSPRLWFQLVPEHKQTKNRVHLDLGSADLVAEVQRLMGLGATELHLVESRVTMADPEGNEFCIDVV